MLAMSMGGLVAQYALGEMERDLRNGVAGASPHQVRLLMTLDSPYQGANVPLSIQLLVRQLAMTTVGVPFGGSIRLTDRLPALGLARDALLSPTAQQLLRYQTTIAGNRLFNIAVAAQTSLYDSFQQEYRALLAPTGGQPAGTAGRPLRIVAVANGSECGRPQPFQPYDMLAQLTYDGNAANFGLLDVLQVPILSGAAGGILAGLSVISGPAAIIGVGIASLFSLGLTGAYDLSAVLNLRALPNQQALPICDVFAQVEKRTRLLGLFRVQITLLEYHASSLSSMLPLDSGSGGIISVASYAQQLAGAGSALPPGVLKQQQFCFTPTYSTLDIAPSSPAALTAQYSPGTGLNTPFINFVTGARLNEEHVTFTAVNSAWMLTELRQAYQTLSCQSFCAANPSLSGPNAICAAGSTFSINDLPAGTTVAWQLATTASVSATTGTGPSFTVNFTGSTVGEGLLTATISSKCGELSFTKSLSIGPPPKPILVMDSQDNCNHIAYFHVENYSRAYTYSSQGTGAVRYSFFVKGTNFTVTATSDCGSASTSGSVIWGSCDGPRPAYAYEVYPNPADSQVTVEQQDNATSQRSTAAPASTPATFTVRLYNSYGTLLGTQQAAGGSLHLATSTLPAGLYAVVIEADGRIVERRQLEIAR